MLLIFFLKTAGEIAPTTAISSLIAWLWWILQLLTRASSIRLATSLALQHAGENLILVKLRLVWINFLMVVSRDKSTAISLA